jgi:hypothetical protein
MANTFVKIATVTVGAGGASSVDFTSIPATYTDLCLKLSLRTNRASLGVDTIYLEFNGSAGTAYSVRFLSGNGTSPSSGSTSAAANIAYAALADGAGATANTFGNCDIYIPNYAGSSFKSVSSDSVNEDNTSLAYAWFNAGLWANTSAITSIKFVSQNSANFVQYSSAILYGIKNS